jgi:NADH-quinone oxidoreductase subunit M
MSTALRREAVSRTKTKKASAAASLGLPGLGNFIAEFLTLMGAWQASPALTIFASIGLVGAIAYSLRIVQKIFYGSEVHAHGLRDLSLREKLIFIPLVIVIIWLGVFPQPVADTARLPIKKSLEYAVKQINQPQRHAATIQEQMLIPKGGSHE